MNWFIYFILVNQLTIWHVLYKQISKLINVKLSTQKISTVPTPPSITAPQISKLIIQNGPWQSPLPSPLVAAIHQPIVPSSNKKKKRAAGSSPGSQPHSPGQQLKSAKGDKKKRPAAACCQGQQDQEGEQQLPVSSLKTEENSNWENRR